jgi:hypothetical protein
VLRIDEAQEMQPTVFSELRLLSRLQFDSRILITVIFEGTHKKLSKKRRQELERICGYFENNRNRMAYDEYLQAGYPIASGVIEGACRHVVKDRMERCGMRWILDGAQAMLGLRCIHVSGSWVAFTRFADQTRNRATLPRICCK